jgi:hypothetical protein
MIGKIGTRRSLQIPFHSVSSVKASSSSTPQPVHWLSWCLLIGLCRTSPEFGSFFASGISIKTMFGTVLIYAFQIFFFFWNYIKKTNFYHKRFSTNQCNIFILYNNYSGHFWITVNVLINLNNGEAWSWMEIITRGFHL